MSSTSLSRRAMIAGTGAAVASAALAVPYVNAARADDVCALPVAAEDITTRLDRLTTDLADAMGEYLNGKYAALVVPGPDHGDVQFVRKDAFDTNEAEMEAAIAAHEKAWLAFEASCDAADTCSPNYAGPEAEARNSELNDAETAALIELMRTPAKGRYASNRKATYLLTTIGGGGRWEPDLENICALLASLA